MSHEDRSAKRKKLKKTKKKDPPARSAGAVGRDHPKAAPARKAGNDLDVPPTLASVGGTVPRRQRLTDLLSNAARRDLASAWGKAEPADEFSPLPPGEYPARIIEGVLRHSKKKTPGYKLTFEVMEGEFIGRKFWHDIWLTPAAVPMAKRDLAKLGVPVDDFDAMRAHLEKPLPEGIRCEVRLTVRTDDDGGQSNRVQRFAVVGIDGHDRDAFAPEDREEDDEELEENEASEEEDEEESEEE